MFCVQRCLFSLFLVLIANTDLTVFSKDIMTIPEDEVLGTEA